MSDFQLSDGTIVRIAPMPPGTTIRPATASFVSLSGGTKADLERSAADKTIRTFDDGMAEDGRVTSTSWMMKIAGITKNADQAAWQAFYAILVTAWGGGTEIWSERKRVFENVYKGGRASVMALPEPTSADNIVDWSADLKGRGLLVETPA